MDEPPVEASRPPRYRVRAPRGRRRIWVVRRARAAVRVPGVRVETTGRRTYDERSVTSTPHRRHARTFPSDRTPNGIVPIPLAPAHAVTRTALRAGPPARVVGARAVPCGAGITSGPNARVACVIARRGRKSQQSHLTSAPPARSGPVRSDGRHTTTSWFNTAPCTAPAPTPPKETQPHSRAYPHTGQSSIPSHLTNAGRGHGHCLTALALPGTSRCAVALKN